MLTSLSIYHCGSSRDGAGKYRVQTMAGREHKAREGKWNGGFAPYGYGLENGELVIAEDEVEIIQMIFDR